MTDLEKLRAFAQGLIEERDHMIDEVGLAGASIEVARAGTAERLIALLDAPPPLTSPDRIPPDARRALDDYAAHGLQPGQCLRAVLAGDLFEAMSRADDETMLALPAIVTYSRSSLSTACWGSREIVARWSARPRSCRSPSPSPRTVPAP